MRFFNLLIRLIKVVKREIIVERFEHCLTVNSLSHPTLEEIMGKAGRYRSIRQCNNEHCWGNPGARCDCSMKEQW